MILVASYPLRLSVLTVCTDMLNDKSNILNIRYSLGRLATPVQAKYGSDSEYFDLDVSVPSSVPSMPFR